MTNNIKRQPVILGGKLPATIRTWMNNEFGSVRTILVNNTVWLAGADVTRILGYKAPSVTIAQQVQPQDKWMVTPKVWKVISNADGTSIANPKVNSKLTLKNNITISSNLSMVDGDQPLPLRGLTFINLSGLYSLVMRAKIPSAQPFQEWVTRELIPAIYQNGAYMTPETVERVENDPAQLKELIAEVKGFRQYISDMEGVMVELKQVLKSAEKDVRFVKEVLQSDELLPTVVIAKDYGMSSQKFNKLLDEMGIQYFQSDRWLVTAPYAERGWKKSYTYKHELEDGRTLVITQTKWTHVGRKELMELLARKGVHPINPSF